MEQPTAQSSNGWTISPHRLAARIICDIRDGALCILVIELGDRKPNSAFLLSVQLVTR